MRSLLIGKNILFREGLAGILRAANFRILGILIQAPMIGALAKRHLDLPFYLIVHTGDGFDAAIEQIALFREQHPDTRIAIVADHYRLDDWFQHFGQAPTATWSTS